MMSLNDCLEIFFRIQTTLKQRLRKNECSIVEEEKTSWLTNKKKYWRVSTLDFA
jgi:hypothetical protein